MFKQSRRVNNTDWKIILMVLAIVSVLTVVVFSALFYGLPWLLENHFVPYE